MLFQKEKLTLAQASRFAGMNRIAFQHLLASRQISVHYGVEDFEQDIKNLPAMGRLRSLSVILHAHSTEFPFTPIQIFVTSLLTSTKYIEKLIVSLTN